MDPKGPKTRQWTVDSYVVDEEQNVLSNREAVVQALIDLEPIGHNEGGAFVVAPMRKPVLRTHVGGEELAEPREEYVTIGWTFQHRFAPALPATDAPERPQEPRRDEPVPEIGEDAPDEPKARTEAENGSQDGPSFAESLKAVAVQEPE